MKKSDSETMKPEATTMTKDSISPRGTRRRDVHWVLVQKKSPDLRRHGNGPLHIVGETVGVGVRIQNCGIMEWLPGPLCDPGYKEGYCLGSQGYGNEFKKGALKGKFESSVGVCRKCMELYIDLKSAEYRNGLVNQMFPVDPVIGS